MSAIGVIDHCDPLQADQMWALQQASYAVEAELIGFAEIPPLLEGVDAIPHLDLTILGATDRGDLVGIVGYRREAVSVDIDRLAVHPRCFRRGYGRKLIEALHVREEDAEHFTVSTGADNLPAVALYGALGYRLVGEETSQGIRIAHSYDTRPSQRTHDPSRRSGTLASHSEHDQAMTERQRVVLVVAWGAVTAIAAMTLNRLLAETDGGWFAYAPNSAVTFAPGRDSTIWREGLVWVGAVLVWAGPSLWLVRPSKNSD